MNINESNRCDDAWAKYRSRFAQTKRRHYLSVCD